MTNIIRQQTVTIQAFQSDFNEKSMFESFSDTARMIQAEKNAIQLQPRMLDAHR